MWKMLDVVSGFAAAGSSGATAPVVTVGLLRTRQSAGILTFAARIRNAGQHSGLQAVRPKLRRRIQDASKQSKFCAKVNVFAQKYSFVPQGCGFCLQIASFLSRVLMFVNYFVNSDTTRTLQSILLLGWLYESVSFRHGSDQRLGDFCSIRIPFQTRRVFPNSVYAWGPNLFQ
jgi:hypothetical protein